MQGLRDQGTGIRKTAFSAQLSALGGCIEFGSCCRNELEARGW
jgi:hypothetical protein